MEHGEYVYDDLNATTIDHYGNDSDNDTHMELCEGLRSQDFLLRSIWMYGGYPILALGTVGHLLSVLLLLVDKRMRALSLSVFLLTMSLAGLTLLYVGLLSTIVMHQSCFHTIFKDMTSEFGCSLHIAAIYVSFQLYSWMEAGVAIERLSAIKWPHQYRVRFTRLNNFISVSVIFVVLLAVNYVPFRSHGYGTGLHCHVVDENLFRWWRYAHCIIGIALPVAIMLTSNGLTLFMMCHSNLRNSTSVQKAKPVTVMMITLNGIFVVTSVPIMVGDWENLDNSEYEIVEIAWCICRLFMYLGSSLTFVVYLLAATRFRKALVELIVSGKSGVERVLSALSSGAYQLSTQTDHHKNGYQGSSTDATSDGAL